MGPRWRTIPPVSERRPALTSTAKPRRIAASYGVFALKVTSLRQAVQFLSNIAEPSFRRRSGTLTAALNRCRALPGRWALSSQAQGRVVMGSITRLKRAENLAALG